MKIGLLQLLPITRRLQRIERHLARLADAYELFLASEHGIRVRKPEKGTPDEAEAWYPDTERQVIEEMLIKAGRRPEGQGE